MNSSVKRVLIGLFAIIFTLTVSAIVFVTITIASERTEVEKYERIYNETKSNVDLINLFYALSKTENSEYNNEKIHYTKMLIEKATLQDIKNSDFSKMYSESDFLEKEPKEFFKLFYFLYIIEAQDFDLLADEFAYYYMQGDDMHSVQVLIMQQYGITKNEEIPNALIVGYETVYKLTTDEAVKIACTTNIDAIKKIVAETNGSFVEESTEPVTETTIQSETSTTDVESTTQVVDSTTEIDSTTQANSSSATEVA